MRLIVLLGVLLLAGCQPSADEEAKVQQALPAGCTVRYLGSFGSVDNLVAVVCDGRRATSTMWQEQQGKVTVTNAALSMED